MRSGKYFLFVLLIFLCSCSAKQVDIGFDENENLLKYAEGLMLFKSDDCYVAEVRDPWNGEKLLARYVIVPAALDLPENLPEGTLLRTPLTKVSVFTSLHASAIVSLGAESSICGICEPQYLTSDLLKARVADKTIANLGEASAPNVERILAAGTEAIFATPLENSNYGAVGKLGIPVIEGADYMETTPLGRAEWIRFYGLLFDRGESADSLFAVTEEKYLHLAGMASQAEHRPSVMTERKYGSSWLIPGGRSYMSRMLYDAGADYIFSDNESSGSANVSFETVFERGADADFWLLKYASEHPMTSSSLRLEYPPYEQFSAFKKRRIFTCNTLVTTYYDDIFLHPESILEDFVFIFHPELMPSDYVPAYYVRIAE